jgi:hypothetical protein
MNPRVTHEHVRCTTDGTAAEKLLVLRRAFELLLCWKNAGLALATELSREFVKSCTKARVFRQFPLMFMIWALRVPPLQAHSGVSVREVPCL